MSYTTVPIANRLGYRQGWSNSLHPQGHFDPTVAQSSQLKTYLLLYEYFKTNQFHLLYYGKCKNSTLKVLNVVFYKKINHYHPKRCAKSDYWKHRKTTLSRIIKANSSNINFRTKIVRKRTRNVITNFQRCVRKTQIIRKRHEKCKRLKGFRIKTFRRKQRQK